MRWTKKDVMLNDTRIKSFFAFLPVTVLTKVNNRTITEYRWLEKVKMQQEYKEIYNYRQGEHKIKWVNIKFIDNDTN